MRFDPKISSLEEITDLDMLSMNMLHGIFTYYEMRSKHENLSKKEIDFKESKMKKRNKNHESKINCSCDDDSQEDEEIEKFIIKLKRGTNKYKEEDPKK